MCFIYYIYVPAFNINYLHIDMALGPYISNKTWLKYTLTQDTPQVFTPNNSWQILRQQTYYTTYPWGSHREAGYCMFVKKGCWYKWQWKHLSHTGLIVLPQFSIYPLFRYNSELAMKRHRLPISVHTSWFRSPIQEPQRYPFSIDIVMGTTSLVGSMLAY